MDVLTSHKALEEISYCNWRAPYIHEFPSLKIRGILCLLIKSGRELTPTCRHKIPSTLQK